MTTVQKVASAHFIVQVCVDHRTESGKYTLYNASVHWPLYGKWPVHTL